MKEKDRKELARQYQPLLIQEVKSVFDYLSPINLGDFIIVDKPTLYYRVTEDEQNYYIFYMTYHYRDWSDWIPPFKAWDEHRHDNEGVLIAISKLSGGIIATASRAHDEIIFSKKIVGFGSSAIFKIEAGGHGIYPAHQIATVGGNYVHYNDFKLVDMDKPVVKKWLDKTVFPIFDKGGVSPPYKWNDSKLRRKEGKRTNGFMFDKPAELFRLANKYNMI